MGRLIDADALIEVLEKYKFGAISNDAERDYVKETVLNFVKEQLTAYNVDAVVAELEEIEEHCIEMYDWQGQSAILDAIDIVKRGVVE